MAISWKISLTVIIIICCQPQVLCQEEPGYDDLLFKQLVAHKINSNGIYLPNLTGLTVVKFKILKNGQVVDLIVAPKSADQRLNKIALDSVKKSVPFPPLPMSDSDPYATCQFTFDPKLMEKYRQSMHYGAGLFNGRLAKSGYTSASGGSKVSFSDNTKKFDYNTTLSHYKKVLSLKTNLNKVKNDQEALANSDKIKLLTDIGITYHDLGKHEKAVKFLTEALELEESVKDKRTTRYILICNALSKAFYETNRF
ncbi:MAG: TonB C-terminal domain-containing protein, partial [Leptolyngbya sp.]|nr:TonB C-terminal domain-containing protein [Candidatus Melainabacteria bacterium]